MASMALSSKLAKIVVISISSIRSKEVKEFLMIEIVNTKGSKRKSSKEHQGLGIGNVKEAIKKYDGTCTIQEEKEKFQVILLLPKTGKEGPLR